MMFARKQHPDLPLRPAYLQEPRFVRKAMFFLVGLALGCFFTQPVMAGQTICRLDSRGASYQGLVDCPTETNAWGSTLHIDETYGGVRTNNGPWKAKTPIDAWGICRYVDNITGSTDDFVPFASSTEWQAFYTKFPTTLLSLNGCARPFNGQDEGHHLYFGPTSARFDMGDTGDPVKADISLPYWRTGDLWPPSGEDTHTFNNQCYEEYVVGHCWQWGTCCDMYGSCSSCCTDSGSICGQRWYSWSEVFNFVGTAQNSDNGDPSWSGESDRQSGCRPGACNVRCAFNGHDCTCPPADDAVCPVQKPVCSGALPEYNDCIKWMCSFFSNNVTGCMIIAADNMKATSDLQNALAANDCAQVSAVISAYTTALNNVENAFCQTLSQQYTTCALAGGTGTACMQQAATNALAYCTANGIELNYSTP